MSKPIQDEYSPQQSDQVASTISSSQVGEMMKTMENEAETETSAGETSATKKNKSFIAMLTGGLLGGFGVTGIGISAAAGAGYGADFHYVRIEGEAVSFSASLKGITKDMPLKATFLDPLTGRKESYEIQFEDPVNQIQSSVPFDLSSALGAFEAHPGRQLDYSLALEAEISPGSKKELAKYPLRITSLVSEIRDVTGYCRCGIDGTYRFQIDFIDQLGIYSEWSSVIEDQFGNKAYWSPGNDLYAEQSIDISALQGSTCTWNLTYMQDGQTCHAIKDQIIHR